MAVSTHTMEENSPITLGSLPTGKVLSIKSQKDSGLYKFYFADGGEVPDELKGMWNIREARRAGAMYLNAWHAKNEAAVEKSERAKARGKASGD